MIASSGAGVVEHFSEVFTQTNASAALAAGIFHRKEVNLFVKSSVLYEFNVTYMLQLSFRFQIRIFFL